MVMIYTSPGAASPAAVAWRRGPLWPALMLFIGALTAACMVLALVFTRYCPRVPAPRDEVVYTEGILAELNCTLVPLQTEVPAGTAVVRYRLEKATAPAGFYVRYAARQKAAYLRPAQLGGAAGIVEVSAYVHALVRTGGAGGAAQDIGLREGAELFEVVPMGGKPSVQRLTVAELEMTDGFMRADFAKNDGWQIKSGTWQLNQYGGGLPQTPAQEADFNFQRTVNPFTIIGRAAKDAEGILLYETPLAAKAENYTAEAAFYFGIPKHGTPEAQWRDPAPNFLMAQGLLDGAQAGFGWWCVDERSPAAWSLCFRRGNEPWRVLRQWPFRLPLSNWVRVGISVRGGHYAQAELDGVTVGEVRLPVQVAGSFHIHTGLTGEAVEFDDVGARPQGRGRAVAAPGQAVFVSSTNFDQKAPLEPRDPIQFEYWARGANTYIEAKERDAVLAIEGVRYTTRLPLYGDFSYRSMPELPPGPYRFFLLKAPVAKAPEDQLAAMVFEKRADGWVAPAAPTAKPEFTLGFERRGGVFGMVHGGKWQPVGVTYPGAAYLMIAPPPGGKFLPAQHDLRSTHTWHDLFESSPVSWYWGDGLFGMNLRWACQPGYNFMVGKSPHVAVLHSDAAYDGDQQIEGYMSFTAVLPADRAYYVRKDLGVSLCTDGRNVDSGYALIFGSEYNGRTVLLKKGVEIATTKDPEFLLPTDPNVLAVHWRWWYFTLRKAGGRLVVTLNDKLMFDVADPDPIPGGQVAFWTVQNGFVLSRFTAVAEGRRRCPSRQVLPTVQTSGTWLPLVPDSVVTQRQSGGVTEVRNALGGNVFAVRTARMTDLAKTPVLELPLRLEPDAKVNLHLEIQQKPWLVRVAAPVDGMEYLLSPVADKVAVRYGQPLLKGDALVAVLLGDGVVTKGKLRLDVEAMLKAKGVTPAAGEQLVWLTVGNSSNDHYLLAGFGGNHAGTRYWVGEPTWTSRTASP